MDKRPSLPLLVYLGFGLRSLRRNPQRTLLSLASLVIGIGVVTFLGALVDGWLHGMHDNFILTYTGHLQVQAPGFHDSGSLEDAIRDPAPVEAVLAQEPAVAAWSERLEASGLASMARGSTGVILLGVQPEREKEVSRLLELVTPGDCLDGGRDDALVLGSEVAATLGASGCVASSKADPPSWTGCWRWFRCAGCSSGCSWSGGSPRWWCD